MPRCDGKARRRGRDQPRCRRRAAFRNDVSVEMMLRSLDGNTPTIMHACSTELYTSCFDSTCALLLVLFVNRFEAWIEVALEPLLAKNGLARRPNTPASTAGSRPNTPGSLPGSRPASRPVSRERPLSTFF